MRERETKKQRETDIERGKDKDRDRDRETLGKENMKKNQYVCQRVSQRYRKFGGILKSDRPFLDS